MTVTYNGETTNFSGEGTVNPQKLVIPGKDKLTPDERTAMLSIEQWCNNLKAPASGVGSTDRIALSQSVTFSGGNLPIGGATVLENVGTSFTLGTNYIQNNEDGVYSFTFVAERDNITTTATTTAFVLGWFDNDSVFGTALGGVTIANQLNLSSGPTFTRTIVGGILSFTYFFPAGDQHFFSCNPSSTHPYNVVISMQRIS